MRSFKIAYCKKIILNLAFASFCTAGYCQQGGGLGQAAGDTLIRNKAKETKGFKPIANINTFYRVHVGLAYNLLTGDSSSQPYRSKHTIGLNYSITEKSFHPYYKVVYPKAFAGWNLSALAGYDGIRRYNFYGVGNETERNTANESFNWLRTENLYASVGVDKTFNNRHTVGLNVLYDRIKCMDDDGRLTAKATGAIDATAYQRQNFLGSRLSYSYLSLNHPAIPTKGIELNTAASYTENLQQRSNSFARFSADADIYQPLSNQFSFVVRSGLATVTGNPDFYQLNTLGGTNTIRGLQRYRLYGKTSFYNQNELRWISKVESKIYKGDFGVFALFDQGRVWHPGEDSRKMHYGYGGGLILAPFNKVVVTAAYAMSKEDRRMHLSVKRIF